MATATQPPVPRPSASVVVVNDRNEILLVHRNPKASAFGGMHVRRLMFYALDLVLAYTQVFPGGNQDKQDASIQMTAIRETFEESGLLLASGTLPDSVLDEARHSIHQQKLNFGQFLKTSGLEADTAALLPFTQWITPVGPPKRFHTQFFVAFLPSAASAGFTSGAKQDRLPTHGTLLTNVSAFTHCRTDGGQEVVEARFVHPKDALEECKQGKVSFMPPQYYLISTLAEIFDGPKNTKEQREKVGTLSSGLFGRMVINPRPLGKDELGRSILTYEGDQTRGGSQGRLHRAHLKMKDGVRSLLSPHLTTSPDDSSLPRERAKSRSLEILTYLPRSSSKPSPNRNSDFGPGTDLCSSIIHLTIFWSGLRANFVLLPKLHIPVNADIHLLTQKAQYDLGVAFNAQIVHAPGSFRAEITS